MENFFKIYFVLLLAASLFLLCPLLLNRARRAALWQAPRLATRPSIHLMDGFVVVLVAFIFLAGAVAAHFYNKPEDGPTKFTATSLALQIVFSLLWLAPVVALLVRRGASLRETFGIRGETVWRDMRLGLRYGVMMIFPVFMANIFTQFFFKFFNLPIKSQGVLLQLADLDIPLALRIPLAIFLFTLVPLVEEVSFRGILIPAFARVEPWPTLLVYQAVFFSLVHCNAAAAPGLFITGICLGLGYARTGSVLTPAVMHAVLNLNAVLLIFLRP